MRNTCHYLKKYIIIDNITIRTNRFRFKFKVNFFLYLTHVLCVAEEFV